MILLGGMVSATSVLAANTADGATWKVRIGLSNVDPKSNNGIVADAQADVKDDVAITFNGVYMVNDSWGWELLAATPFEHDIELAGLGEVGSTKHLPPTLSAQYYIKTNSKFTPYFGLGLNYTHFFNEKALGPIAGNDLKLDASFGLALQAGVDYDLNSDWLLNFEIRYIDIEADVKLNGADIGTAKIDPLLVGVNIGRKF